MRKIISLLMLCCLLAVSLGCGVYSQPAADPIQVSLSREERNRLDDFFCNFSLAGLEPFSCGQLDETVLISFSLEYLVLKKYSGRKFHGSITSNEVNEAANRYFGKVPKIHRSVSGWTFNDGVYQKTTYYGMGEMPPFSQVDELRYNGDGTFTATVSVYSQVDGWKGDPHGTMDEWEKGDSLFWPRFKAKYRALIRPIRDGDGERYILLEYVLAQ